MAMTRTARKLGMTRTVFRNASGLPDGEQRTTARDLARLASRLIRGLSRLLSLLLQPELLLIAAARTRTTTGCSRVYPGMDGLKTGYTRASGFNLAASAVRDGRRLVAVVIGGRTAGARDATMVALLDRGFERAAPQQGEEVLVARGEPAARQTPGRRARSRGREPGHHGVRRHCGGAVRAPEARSQAATTASQSAEKPAKAAKKPAKASPRRSARRRLAPTGFRSARSAQHRRRGRR